MVGPACERVVTSRGKHQISEHPEDRGEAVDRQEGSSEEVGRQAVSATNLVGGQEIDRQEVDRQEVDRQEVDREEVDRQEVDCRQAIVSVEVNSVEVNSVEVNSVKVESA